MSDVPMRWLRGQSDRLHGERRISARLFRRRGRADRRGNCAYEEKIDNAQAAGAVLALIYNNQDGDIFMDVGSAVAAGVQHARGPRAAFVDFHRRERADNRSPPISARPGRADVLAPFSLRGPDVLTTITKPDLTAPGINIYAALDQRRKQLRLFQRHVDVLAARRRRGRAAARDPSGLDAVRGQVRADAHGRVRTAARGKHRRRRGRRTTSAAVGWICARRRWPGSCSMKRYPNYFAADPAQRRRSEDAESRRDAQRRRLRRADAVRVDAHAARCAAGRIIVDGQRECAAGVAVTVDPPTFSFAGTGEGADTIFTSGFDAIGCADIAVTATTDPSLARRAIRRARIPRGERRRAGCAHVCRS